MKVATNSSENKICIKFGFTFWKHYKQFITTKHSFFELRRIRENGKKIDARFNSTCTLWSSDWPSILTHSLTTVWKEYFNTDTNTRTLVLHMSSCFVLASCVVAFMLIHRYACARIREQNTYIKRLSSTLRIRFVIHVITLTIIYSFLPQSMIFQWIRVEIRLILNNKKKKNSFENRRFFNLPVRKIPKNDVIWKNGWCLFSLLVQR